MYLTPTQIDALLRPIDQGRVKKTQGFSHLEQHDVRRWLTRIFGFAGWSMAVNEVVLVAELPNTKDGPDANKWDVLYRATVTLTVMAEDGTLLASYTDVATGDSQNVPLIAGHDLAVKSAVSTALKRAATCLGDQFGLSLYWGGQDAFTAKVVRTLHGVTADQPIAEVTDTPVTSAEDNPEVEPEVEVEELPEGVEEPERDGRVEQIAADLIKAAKMESTGDRSRAITKASLLIGKEGLATAMTSYGVTLTVLVDRAFKGEK